MSVHYRQMEHFADRPKTNLTIALSDSLHILYFPFASPKLKE
jgi:hypothetical protein